MLKLTVEKTNKIPTKEERLKEKIHYIEFLRDNRFICFPIPPGTKMADFRYQASRTEINQKVGDDENYGYIPMKGAANAIIDLDLKERYRAFAETIIKDGFMVIETGKGWHIPICNVEGEISKIELFDYKISDNKVVEIQGPDHYCVGPGSYVEHEELKQTIIYHNVGSDKIWAVKNVDYHNFIEHLCKTLKVVGRKRKNRSSYKNFRHRFLEGLPPTKGTSNDYFFQAAIQCNSDGLTQNEATSAIQKVYDVWSETDQFSHRPWSNIEVQIQNAYENNETISAGRTKGKNTNEINRTEIALQLLASRKLYSNMENEKLFENTSGFLELINLSLRKDLLKQSPEIEQHDFSSIMFKLVGMADELPPTNKDLVMFPNGAFSKKGGKIVELGEDEIADLGFKQYNYLEKSVQNEPKEFIKLLFGNIKKSEHPRIKAGLKKIFECYVDPRISVLQGDSGVGKSTAFLILCEVLGEQYAMSVELDQLLDDHFIKAKIDGKILLVLQDLPQTWKDFTQIKTLTGEQKKMERGFQQDSITIDNKLKIWATTNYLPKIPEKEKNAMYTRRLSLNHNIRKEPYPDDSELAPRIINDEGEKIVSWILNLPDEECQYEHSNTVRTEWEKLASPEIEYFRKNWYLDRTAVDVHSVGELMEDFQDKYQISIDVDQMEKSLKGLGCIIKWGVISNIKPIINRGLG